MFSEEEALLFLAGQTGLADDAAAATVAAELGYLPLALAQAATVIARQHLDYQAYLDRLQALPAGEPLIADLERMLGPNHPDTMNSRNNLALAYKDADRAS